MLWIALYIPEFSLQIAARGMVHERAMVIKDGPANHPIVIAASGQALALGIQLGMPVAAAEALTSKLLVVPRNKDNETHALYRFAVWALQFTPTVTLQPYQGILLEVASTLRLQGGLRALLTNLASGCAQLGYRVMYGIAPTAHAAWWFALAKANGATIADIVDTKHLRGQLGKLRANTLDLPAPTIALFDLLGIRTLADCLALPRAEFTERFGVELTHAFDQALGLQPDVRSLFAMPKAFHSRIELPAEVTEVDALLFPIKRLLIELEGFLSGLGAGIQTLRIELEQGSKQRASFKIGLLAPEREGQRLLMLISAKLANLQLDHSVWAVSLHAEQLLAFAGKQRSFLVDQVSHQLAWRQLLERLQARLGKAQVQTIANANDH